METDQKEPVQITLTDSLKIQRRIIWALIMREMLTRYGRNNIGFLWLFVEPIAFILVITAIWTSLRSIHGSDIPIMVFALTGYSSILLWRNLPGRCIGAIDSNSTLLHHRHVRVLDIFVARILLEQGAVTASFTVLGLLMWAVEWIGPPEDVLKVLFGWILLAWFGAGLALTLAGLADRWEVVAKFWAPISIVLFPISGAAYLADALPQAVRELALLIPMLNGLELLREGYFGSQFTAHYDLPYLMGWNLGLSLFGLSQIARIGIDRVT